MKGTVFLLEDDKSICELVRCALEMADIDTVCFNTCLLYTSPSPRDCS